MILCEITKSSIMFFIENLSSLYFNTYIVYNYRSNTSIHWNQENVINNFKPSRTKPRYAEFYLFGVFRPTREFDVTFTGEGLQILTSVRHSRQLSIEGSLKRHTYCDTGHTFIMVFSEDPWLSHLLPSVWQWSCHMSVFYDLGLSRLGFEHPTFRLRCKRSNPLRHRSGRYAEKITHNKSQYNRMLVSTSRKYTCLYLTMRLENWY